MSVYLHVIGLLMVFQILHIHLDFGDSTPSSSEYDGYEALNGSLFYLEGEQEAAAMAMIIVNVITCINVDVNSP